jgi:hypothetical protein
MTKSVTEIISEMNDKIDLILAYNKNQDMLLKNIANRLAEQECLLNNSRVKDAGAAEDAGLAQLQANIEENIISEKKEVILPGLKKSIALVTKTPVQQRILYSEDQRPIAMANIEISKDEGINGIKVVKVAKTNATGKWVAALDPGNYCIKISKKETSTKSRVDYSGTLTVVSSKDPINLEDIVI